MARASFKIRNKINVLLVVIVVGQSMLVHVDQIQLKMEERYTFFLFGFIERREREQESHREHTEHCAHTCIQPNKQIDRCFPEESRTESSKAEQSKAKQHRTVYLTQQSQRENKQCNIILRRNKKKQNKMVYKPCHTIQSHRQNGKETKKMRIEEKNKVKKH